MLAGRIPCKPLLYASRSVWVLVATQPRYTTPECPRMLRSRLQSLRTILPIASMRRHDLQRTMSSCAVRDSSRSSGPTPVPLFEEERDGDP